MKLNSNENQVKNKLKIERSEYNPVPLYRSYGVTTKERPLWVKIKVIVQKIAATAFIGIPLSVIAVGMYAWMFASGLVIIPTVIYAAVGVFAFVMLSKPLRLRLKLIRALKKLCKKHGYKHGFKLEMSNSPFSRKWSSGECEFVFHTNSRVYHVRMFAIRKYRTRLRFESDKEITLIVPPLNNKFTVIYDLKSKQKKLSIDFGELADAKGKETVKALVFCPTCEEWSYRYSNNTYIPTGNAETVFGYKVYTVSGILSDIKRMEEI